ncbi:MAG: hypothetical protein HOI95_15165 [Chromatiales bacterium]|jgi:cytochrome c553|nr:hypothetical protein [Chromatiales bacterium]
MSHRYTLPTLLLLLLAAGPLAAGGDPVAGKAMLCVGSHGMDGNSTNPMWPKIAGQHEAYLAKQVRAFK